MFYIELPEEKPLKEEEKDCSENVKDDPGFVKQSVFYVEMKNAPKPRSSVYGGARKKYAKLTESRTTSIKPAIPPKPRVLSHKSNLSEVKFDGEVSNFQAKECVDMKDKEDECQKKHFLNGKKAKLKELLQTEENYVNNLLKISEFSAEMKKSMNDAMHPIKMPEHLKNYEQELRINFQDILDFHQKTLLCELQASFEKPQKVKDIFKNKKHHLKDIYGKYCINWRRCEELLEKFHDSYFEPLKQYLNFEFQLQDLMIKPIQRLNSYHMFFGDLAKLCRKLGEENNAANFQECWEISKEICLNANDFVATGSIMNFPDSQKIDELGVLIRRGNVQCRVQKKVTTFGSSIFSIILKNNVQNVPSHIFLFKKCVMICSRKKNGKHDLEDTFCYSATLLMNKMKVEDHIDNIFTLCDTENELKMHIEAISAEDKEDWMTVINKEISRITIRNRKERKFLKVNIFKKFSN